MLVRVLGAPTTYEVMHTAEGEIGRADFAPLVEIIRRAAAHQGEVTEQLGSLEWNTVGEPSQIHVTVSPRDGRTSVRIFADRGPAGVLTFLLPGVAGLLAIGIGGAILEPSTMAGVGSLIAASLGGAWVAGRTIWKNTTKSFQQRLGRLQKALAEAVDRCAEPTTPTDPKR